MKLFELIKNTEWDNVKECLVKEYPDQEDNLDAYERIFVDLKNRILEDEDTKMLIEIYTIEEQDDGNWNQELIPNNEIDRYKDCVYTRGVHGVSTDETEKDERYYTLSLENWNYWLNCVIDEQTEKDFKFEEIIAHCLWDMTFFGYDEKKINSEKEEILSRANEVRNEIQNMGNEE
jgi:hypothetical protein